jgi:hypothetical protein
MNKEERMSLADMQKKIEEVHEGIQFIRYGIKVNGQSGLEPILIESNRKLINLENRTGFLEKITAKTRSSYELWGAFQRWAEQHKLFAFMFKIFLNKTMFKLALVFFGILCVALFGDRALALFNKIYHTFK